MLLDSSFLLRSFLLATTTVATNMPFHDVLNRAGTYSNRKRSSRMYSRASCEPAEPLSNVTERLNQLLNTGGAGYTLSLCPNQNYPLTAALQFTASGQEISTLGLPMDNSRAMLTITGPTLQPSNQPNHTTAVQGQCPTCNGVKLRHIQINGARLGAPAVNGGANIEMGGATSGQVVEYVRSFDPRSWSCLHLAEGDLKCSSAIVQNNDIGPCGSDAWEQWADGISVACANTVVRNNLVNTATDGGVVVFGSPGSVIQNNTIWVENNTMLGGINMVDYEPWLGDYDGTIVRQNRIIGGLATSSPTSQDDTRGTNDHNAIIKMGIAVGPRIWFANHFLANVSHGGMVQDNEFEGAFGYAMAISSARNFTVLNNLLVGNTSFIGSPGPNCSVDIPPSQPFIAQQDNISQSLLQKDFTNITNGDGLTCIVPPQDGDHWPFGGRHDPSSPPPVPSQPFSNSAPTSSQGLTTEAKVGIAIGVIVGVLFIAIAAWFIHRRSVNRLERIRQMASVSTAGYTQSAAY